MRTATRIAQVSFPAANSSASPSRAPWRIIPPSYSPMSRRETWTRKAERIVELLRQLAHQGRTIIVVTHERSIAKQADLRIELEDGQIEA